LASAIKVVTAIKVAFAINV